jgi:hypothetical protein
VRLCTPAAAFLMLVPPGTPQVAKAVREAEAAKAAGSRGHWIRLSAEDGRPYFWNKVANVSK